jgi:hypothetical protein
VNYANLGWMPIWAAALALSAGGSASAAGAEPAAADAVAGVWRHHQVTFNYMAFTSLYTCSGLEDQVRRILVHLGARKDLKVRAVGCPGTDGTPSRNAFVDADFYSLAPAEAAGSDTVTARWTALELSPQRPSFMGDGDCELVERMKDTIIQNFSLRGIEYRTDCLPHEIWPEGFSVKGQTLRAVAPAASAVTG